ncbi:hypothetical protein [Sphingomonas quercus]|uniref:Uncharacterized protein n=1 Tax=Sphingomonas quercus TaxID=2842451 RepID=A0ABS6BM63_9SPHN|nr:hypothetical protein [Sphingomonas quercus]MBU3078712.1 hypothetical protein [Sphingomonas quercus]
MRTSARLIAITIIVDLFLLGIGGIAASRLRYYFASLDYFGRYGLAETVTHIWIGAAIVLVLFTGGMVYAIILLRRRGD